MVLLSASRGYSQSEGYGTEYSHYKAKGAFEGIWLYENSNESIKFEIRLKCVYRLTTTGDTLTEIMGIYDLYKGGKKLEMTSIFVKYYDRPRYDSLFLSISSFSDYEEFSRELRLVFPVSGCVSAEDNDFVAYDMIKDHPRMMTRDFRIDVGCLEASNSILIWDIWKESTAPEYHITGKEPKPGDYNIPEKCILTRISKDPYSGMKVQ